jgi:hypothetical protein
MNEYTKTHIYYTYIYILLLFLGMHFPCVHHVYVNIIAHPSRFMSMS